MRPPTLGRVSFHYEILELTNILYIGWLIATSVKVASKKVDMYQLSTRARTELEHYLSEEYPNQMNRDFECKVCNEMVMKVRL